MKKLIDKNIVYWSNKWHDLFGLWVMNFLMCMMIFAIWLIAITDGVGTIWYPTLIALIAVTPINLLLVLIPLFAEYADKVNAKAKDPNKTYF